MWPTAIRKASSLPPVPESCVGVSLSRGVSKCTFDSMISWQDTQPMIELLYLERNRRLGVVHRSRGPIARHSHSVLGLDLDRLLQALEEDQDLEVSKIQHLVRVHGPGFRGLLYGRRC